MSGFGLDHQPRALLVGRFDAGKPALEFGAPSRSEAALSQRALGLVSADKARRLGCPPSESEVRRQIWDVAGVRIVCSFISEVYTVMAMLTSHNTADADGLLPESSTSAPGPSP